MSITPVKVSPIPRSVSDASMGYNEDDMLDSPPTRGMPDVRALADALEPPPDMAALKATPHVLDLPGSSIYWIILSLNLPFVGSFLPFIAESANVSDCSGPKHSQQPVRDPDILMSLFTTARLLHNTIPAKECSMCCCGD